jgi:hypothetical protein
LPLVGPDGWELARAAAAAVVESRGFRADLWVFLDIPSDTPYPEPMERSPDGLWVILQRRPIQRLGDVSFLLRELRNKTIERPRLVFPAEVRDEVVSAVEGALGS